MLLHKYKFGLYQEQDKVRVDMYTYIHQLKQILKLIDFTTTTDNNKINMLHIYTRDGNIKENIVSEYLQRVDDAGWQLHEQQLRKQLKLFRTLL